MPRLRLLLLSAVLAFACAQALAQFGGGTRRGRGDSSREGAGDGSGVTRMSANDRIRMQLTDLRLALKLAPEQNPLFDAYQNRVYALLEPWSAPPDFPSAAAPETLAKIAHKVGIARGRWAQMQDVYDAAAKLYAGLTPEQRQIADRALPDTVPSPAAGGWGSDTAGPSSSGRKP